MSYMFQGASSFNKQDLSAWNVSKVTDMQAMFYNAASFDQSFCFLGKKLPMNADVDKNVRECNVLL
jgi:surface protein